MIDQQNRQLGASSSVDRRESRKAQSEARGERDAAASEGRWDRGTVPPGEGEGDRRGDDGEQNGHGQDEE